MSKLTIYMDDDSAVSVTVPEGVDVRSMCSCDPDCCLAEDNDLGRCIVCAVGIDPEEHCPIADAEPHDSEEA